ncbi:MAG: MBL fold metallo-hydrolase [Deltaproteobacteria bacterium]|nr:MBL fold metallo-hydrolase [Deltaproteobacteria bacterium]
MYFKQIAVEGLGCFSYCIGCPRARAMAVVDPKRDIQDYLDISRNEGMRITHIIETHVHADHVSGAQELKAATGADIHIQKDSPVSYPRRPLDEGDVIVIGPAQMEVVHTPGHTPHAISLLVTDTARSPEPEMILTGDVLFVGDIGRPDLAGQEILDEQISNLYTSLYVKLAKYPDHVEVFPAHGEGSLCGRGMSPKRNSTLGYERRANPMLRFASFEDFAREIGSTFPTRPKSFTHIIETNMKGAPLLDTCPMDKAMTPGQFEGEMKRGALVIDVRDSAGFGGFHIPGSVNIGFEKQLANWVGMVVDPDSDLLLVVPGRNEYERMVTELHRIGYDRIFGYLSGGIMSWLLSGRPVAQLPQISPHQLRERQNKTDFTLLDVRTPAERAAGKLERSEHLPLTDILAGKFPSGDPDREIVVYCGSGFRSNIAASFLRQHGHARVSSMAGGIFAWTAAGFPVIA